MTKNVYQEEIKFSYGGYWWLRSPNYNNSNNARNVNNNGNANNNNNVNNDNMGVVPDLSLHSLEMQVLLKKKPVICFQGKKTVLGTKEFLPVLYGR
ncbi:MAG: hypothetical protein IKX23_10675 [Treponema sp.]|nr:hypothetical protein [Treponema sp.]